MANPTAEYQASVLAQGTDASQWTTHTAPNGRNYFYNAATGVSTWERPAELGPDPTPQPPLQFSASQTPYSQHQTAQSGHSAALTQSQDYNAFVYGQTPYVMPLTYGQSPYMISSAYGVPPASTQFTYQQNTQSIGPGAPIQTTAQAQGPMGCNLFIFHIPNECTNQELYSLFSPFGNVISARIMVEKETGRSRGFGFVSYDNNSSAEAAIKEMDGFQIGRKRLKVQHKKERNDRQRIRNHTGHPGGAGFSGALPGDVRGFVPGAGAGGVLPGMVSGPAGMPGVQLARLTPQHHAALLAAGEGAAYAMMSAGAADMLGLGGAGQSAGGVTPDLVAAMANLGIGSSAPVLSLVSAAGVGGGGHAGAPDVSPSAAVDKNDNIKKGGDVNSVEKAAK